MTDANKALSSLNHGNQFPYDRSDGGARRRGVPHSKARMAVLGILADLGDRWGNEWSLEEIDQETREEIVDQLTEIIRQAYK